jgi:hypothetical protein
MRINDLIRILEAIKPKRVKPLGKNKLKRIGLIISPTTQTMA